MEKAEIVKVTGVTQKYVDNAFKKFHGDSRSALASIVQSMGKMPAEALADKDAIYKRENMDAVNKALKDTYKQVRELKGDLKTATEADCWKALRENNWEYSKASAALGGSNSSDDDSDDGEAKVVARPPKKIPAPTHETGPLYKMPHFWETEVEARCTLMNLNYGFMERNKDKMPALRTRLMKWVDKAGAFHRDAPIQYYEIVDRDEETTRVIIKDVVRTFFDQRTRTRLENFLFAVFQEFNTYAQPVSFIASICLLVLDEQETIAVLRKIAKEYIPGHWAPVATGFATNAWLIESVIKVRYPDVMEHFNKLNFWPDTYMQKICNALGVHVFPFDLMFDFLDAFIDGGFVFLVKFELAVIEHFRSRLLAITDPNDINQLFDLMRLDLGTVPPDEQRAILERALAIDGSHDDFQGLDLKRMTVYDEKIAPRLQKAPKEAEFEPCGICEKLKPEIWCDDCELAICPKCDRKEKGEHKKSHKTEVY